MTHDEGFASLTLELMEEVPDPKELVEDLLRLLAAEIVSPTTSGGSSKSGAGEWGPPAELTVTDEGFARLFMSAGRMHGIRPGDVVGAIAGESGLPGKVIGSIDIYEKFTFLEVQADHAAEILESCGHLQIRGNTAQIRPATERGDAPREERGGYDRGGRGGYDRGGRGGYEREGSFEPRDRREGGRGRMQREHSGPGMDLSRAPEDGMARLFVSMGRNSGLRPG
ncbi:MAG: DbpA RNA binding domain-containing protein, partial [Planctomycetes bacterium]|nr:DbpA RNA binding domain-containing protein [Planctomycetota bacterium]